MASTPTTRIRLNKPAYLDAAWNTTWDANADALDALAPVGGLFVAPAESPSASLNIRVAAGSFRNASGTMVDYAGTSSFACTTAATNSIYLTNSGTLTKSTSGYPAATDIVRLATVVAGATTITSITDDRAAFAAFGATVATSAPSTAKYIVQQADATLSAEQALGALATGILKNATTTGVLSIAAAGTDYLAPSTAITVTTISATAITCTTVTASGLITANAGLTLGDAQNIVVNTTTGTKIATSTSQKLSFWNTTPVVQPASANQAATAALTSATLTDSTTGTANSVVVDVTASHDQAILNANFADLVAQHNALRSDLVVTQTLLTAIRSALVTVGLMKGSA